MKPARLVFATSLLVPGACKKQDDSVIPICLNEVAADEAAEAQSGQMPTYIWYQFLLKNYNRKTGMVASPLKDCSNRLVEPELAPEQAECLTGKDAGQPLPDRALTDDDLLISPLEDGRTLMWVKAKHFTDGEALGPIAITEWIKSGIAVRSIGAMRAQANRARMRIEPMGQAKVLVVESDACKPDDPKQCERMMRLVPITDNRFVQQAVVLEDGSCIGPAEFALFSAQEFTSGTKVRRFELTRTFDFTDGNVVMSESVVIKDRDTSKPDEPAKTYRNANVLRPMTLGTKGIVTKPGIWEPMLAEHGSVAYVEEKKPETAAPPK
ncbi:MAG: hypothetical protein IAG13_39000 [Deltaproteobacteria bacterium]|nr:hypothetical protein [Nannocystaceae bacterium]